MKKITPLLFFWLASFLLPVNISAQSNACADFDFSFEVNHVSCGETRGSINLAVTGSQSNQLVIEWSHGGSSLNDRTNIFVPNYEIVDLKAGQYTVKVSDFRSGCSLEKTIDIEKNAAPEGIIVTGNPVTCKGVGSIYFKIPEKPPFYLNLRGPVTANYLANSNTFSLYNLPAGDYEIDLVKDGCVATVTATIGAGNNLPQLNVTALEGTCGISTGAVQVTASGGKAGYTLSWTGPTKGSTQVAATDEVTGFETGSYKFTLEDAKGCKSIKNLTIDRSGLSVELVASEAICNSNGSIKVNITSGTAPYTIDYKGSAEGSKQIEGKNSLLSLGAGTYEVTITDANGCTTFATTTISLKATDLYASLNPYKTTCGTDNGKLKVFITGGKKPYTLTYQGPTSESIKVNGWVMLNDLPAGTYTILVEDSEGCIVSESSEVTVGAFDLPKASFTYAANGTEVLFFNTSTTGTSSWSFGDSKSSNRQNPSHTYTNSGLYVVCLTTKNDCGEHTFCEQIQIAAFKDISKENIGVGNVPTVGKKDNKDGGFKIQQNFPNPFTNSTDILFELPEAQLTTILIQDHFGRTVQTKTALFEKGLNKFTFNQNNLASGVYFYTIRTGDQTLTKSMVIE